MKILEVLINRLREIITDVREDIQERREERRAERLDKLAAGQNLDWRGSVVDLFKTAGLDSSAASRKQLYGELGLKGEYTGTAEQNIALHDAVLDALAEHKICLPKPAK